MLRSITLVGEMTTPISATGIDDIVAAAQKRNQADDITGALFCLGDMYIQVIEGPSFAVDSLCGRMQRDRRFRHLKTIEDVSIEARAYGGRPMVYVHNEDLTRVERAIVFRALQAFEPQTVFGPKVGSIDGVLAEAMEMIMARAVPPRPNSAEAEAVSELLYATELRLLRGGRLDDLALTKIAVSAHVPLNIAKRLFPTINDLIRTCVLRVLALEHQNFFNVAASKPFESVDDLARAVSDFIIEGNTRSNVSSSVAEQFAIHGGNFTSETAWIMARAMIEGKLTERLSSPQLTTVRLAIAIDAADAAARILARNDAAGLADPKMRALILDICRTALNGGQPRPN